MHIRRLENLVLHLEITRCRSIAMDLLSMTDKGNDVTFMRKMRSCFGVSVHMVCTIWRILTEQEKMPDNAEPKHLFWALGFLKTYATEHSLAVWFKCDEKTLRKWVWIMIDALSSLEIVSIIFYLYN